MKWTTKKVERLKELAGNIKVADIAKELDATEKAVWLKAHKLKISLRVPVVREYRLYRGDETLFMGTIPEIARFWGVSEDTIRDYATPSRKKNVGENSDRVVVEKII